MKFALIGSAPSSIGLAPFADAECQIWACSPGTYPVLPRCDAFFEMHRPEFGEIGKPGTQKTWFSPEYVAWIGLQKKVWVAPKALDECRQRWPNAEAYPLQHMTERFGNAFWTSSLAYMSAMAIDQILAAREKGDEGPHTIGYFGVDMSADSEVYSQQKAGCHVFIMLAHMLGIEIFLPPESDLLRPTGAYGIDESEHWHIKGLARKAELDNRVNTLTAQAQNAQNEIHYIRGALDDHNYHMRTWMTDRQLVGFNAGILAASPAVRRILRERFDAERIVKIPPVVPIPMVAAAPTQNVVDIAPRRATKIKPGKKASRKR